MAPGLWLSHRQWGQSSRKRPVCVGQEAHRELFLGALGFKLDLEKGEEPEIKLPTSAGSQEKQENSRKTSTSVSLTTLKSLTVWITTNCGKFLEMGIPDHLTCLLRSRSNS